MLHVILKYLKWIAKLSFRIFFLFTFPSKCIRILKHGFILLNLKAE